MLKTMTNNYPRTATSAELVVYWFLRCYQVTEGEPYKMRSQTELANRCGVSQSVISGLLAKKPEWLEIRNTETILRIATEDAKEDAEA